MSLNTELQKKIIETINQLFNKYGDDEYMLQRLITRVTNYLPNELDNDYRRHEKNVTRTNFLTNEQQLFIQIFLSKNQYYYLTHNNCFYEYNGKNYTIVKEDDIIYKLLSTISKDRILLEWKHKTKKNIISLIKERSLFQCIPNTDTIQDVLNTIYPALFSSKTQAKYFLTIIGDNILKKNQHLIFLVTPKTKKIIVELDTIAYLSVGATNTTNNFMTKYHENHCFENCRLININDGVCLDMWSKMLKKIGLNLLCVSTHYSNRYKNSDVFMESKGDEDFKNYTYYLKNTTQNNIVKQFAADFFQEGGDGAKIEWKHIHFIWKQFLSNTHVPNVIYSNTLKTMLKEYFHYNEETDTFINITSKYLPIESDFIKFWDKTIQTSVAFQEIDCELEIDEICTLFKHWVKQGQDDLYSNGTISDENVIKILKHFFQDNEIVENKYVLNVNCVLWDKNKDLQDFFIYAKSKAISGMIKSLISFDDAYNLYFKYCNLSSSKFIVSKRYFEKYVYVILHEHIVYESFIELVWV